MNPAEIVIPTSKTLKPGSKLNARLGGMFRRARHDAGKTLVQTADAIGVSVNTVRWHENGTTPLRAHHLALAALLFGCPPDRLLLPADPDDTPDDAEASAG